MYYICRQLKEHLKSKVELPHAADVVVVGGLEAHNGEDGNGCIHRCNTVDHTHQNSISLTVIPDGHPGENTDH